MLEVANRLGVAQSTVSGWENEKREPDIAMIRAMADLYGVSADYILGIRRRPTGQPSLVERLRAAGIEVNEIDDDSEFGIRHLYRLPVLGTIRAGQPIEMIRDVATEWEDADATLIRGRAAFILRVTGDSMIGDHIYDGDRVVVLYTPDFTPSDICVVAVDGDDATLKRVKCQGDVCVLTPSNPSMEPMVYPLSAIHVIGVVVEIRHRLKR